MVTSETEVVNLWANLDGNNGFVINGIALGDRNGSSVSSAGDVNGDGYDDFIIGARTADPNGEDGAGESYVVFGNESGFDRSFDLASLLPSNGGDGSRGFIIKGIAAGDTTGAVVSNAGDVNGDGYDDIIIAAELANPNGVDNAGSAYVVFGQESFTPTLELSSLTGSNGFAVHGLNPGDRIGISVSDAGDINNDGLADVIISADGINNLTGGAYVIYGSRNFSTVVGTDGILVPSELDGNNGFIINGSQSGERAGISLSHGDINNDGFDDLIIGAPLADPGGRGDAGKTYVVYGGTNLAPTGSFALSSVNGSNGFVINGIDPGDRFGGASGNGSSAGDVNNDGYDDIIIGAYGADPDGIARPLDDGAGESYVIYGGSNVAPTGSFNLSNLDGTNGIVINGREPGDSSGIDVGYAGDINNDGFGDILIGAPNRNDIMGEAYVVYGSSNLGTNGSVNLSELDPNTGFAITSINNVDGSPSNNQKNSFGAWVSDAGDLNNDGIEDIIIGSPNADPAGKAYVVFGNIAPELDLNSSDAGIDFAVTFTFGGGAVEVADSNLTLQDFDLSNNSNLTPLDPNTATVAGATVTITNLLDGIGESLSANATGTSITASYSDSTGILTLSGTDTIANYQQVLATISYENTAATPDTTPRILEFEVDDGQVHTNTSVIATTTIFLNQPPFVSQPLPDKTIDAYTPFSFEIPGDTFNDSDGDNLNFTATNTNGDPLPDWLTFDATTQTFIGLPFGSDQDTFSLRITADDGIVTISDSFDLVVNFPSNPITQTILGTSGDDSLSGKGNNETIKAKAGNDTVLGKGGDDNLRGGSGNDDLRGGSGNDIISGDGGTDNLRGGNNNDILFGGSAGDELRGGAGDDLLDGGNGVDILLGGKGSDRLIGGKGQDFLTGGDDPDEFVLTPNQGRDTIKDYEDGIDSFLLTTGLSFADLSFQSNAGSTLIKAQGKTLATLLGVDASILGAEDFTTVADLLPIESI